MRLSADSPTILYNAKRIPKEWAAKKKKSAKHTGRRGFLPRLRRFAAAQKNAKKNLQARRIMVVCKNHNNSATGNSDKRISSRNRLVIILLTPNAFPTRKR